MVELKHVGVLSAAKVLTLFQFVSMILYCVLMAAISLVYTGSLMLFMLFGSSIMMAVSMLLKMNLTDLGDAVPYVGFLILFIAGMIIGFISGAISALIYNVIARVVGGVDVTFTKKDVPGALPEQQKIVAVAAVSSRTSASTASAASAGASRQNAAVATAVNPELLNYVKNEFAAGRAKEEVVAELVKAGWTPDDIHAALNAAVLG